MNRNDRARERETSKTFFSFSSEAEVSDVESRDENYSGSYDEQSTIVCFGIKAGILVLMFCITAGFRVFLICITAEVWIFMFLYYSLVLGFNVLCYG